MPAGPLTDLRIADFGRVLVAPYATMMLADLGAEVIKIEGPGGGDETRSWGPPWSDGVSTYFLTANRNKQSIVIDLKTEGGRSRARDVIAGCDVLIENFRPGTMDRFGLGFDDLSNDYPDLVYCSLTGFGADRGAALAGYDLIVQAVGGLMSITGEPGGTQTKVGVALVDVVTGLHAVTGILSALRHRDGGGGGQRVEVNLMSSLLSALANQASSFVATGISPGLMGNCHPSIAPYEVFDTFDRPIAIAAANDKLFAALAHALHRPELLDDPRFASNAGRVEHRAALGTELEATLATQSADRWFEILSDVGVPCGPINDIGQAFKLAEDLGLHPVVEIAEDERTVRQVANPIRLSATPVSYQSAPPVYRDTVPIDG